MDKRFCKGITSNIELVRVTTIDVNGINGIVETGVHKGKTVYVSNSNIIKGKAKKEYNTCDMTELQYDRISCYFISVSNIDLYECLELISGYSFAGCPNDEIGHYIESDSINFTDGDIISSKKDLEYSYKLFKQYIR